MRGNLLLKPTFFMKLLIHLRKVSAIYLAFLCLVKMAGLASASSMISVELGKDSEAWAKALNKSGDVRPEALSLEMGSLRTDIEACTIRGRGSELSLTLQPPPGIGSLLLEVEEVHNRRPATLAYSILVDGQPAYFRTYDELGAGRNHYFVNIPDAAATRNSLTITFRNASAAPFSLSRIWIFRNFTQLAEKDKTYRPMAVAENPTWLLTEFVIKGADGKPVRKTQDPETQARAWTTIKERMKDTPYSPSVLQIISYGNTPAKEIDKAIRKALETTATNAVDLNLSLNASEWGYHPNGPDGLGGFFSDINYSKVLFRPESGDFRPTWLNTPGNTTWPTWNHPQLNRFWNYRIAQAVRSYANQRDFLRAQGAKFPRPTVNQEWGFSVGDRNDATLSAAARDHITIDPKTAKLDETQKQWVFQNAAAAAARFGKSFDDAAGKDRVVVDRGVVSLPDGQSLDDNFFQTFADAIEPYYDDQWAGWQFGVSPYSSTTGEFLPHHPEGIYDYICALGKLVGPNIERLCLPTLDYYQVLYERGFLQITPLNPRPGEIDNFLPQSVGLRERSARSPVDHNRKLLELAFRNKSGNLGPENIIAQKANLQISSQGLGMVMSKPPESGEILYKIHNPEPVSKEKLTIELDARIPKDKGGKITILLGDSPSTMNPAATFAAKDLGPVLNFTGTQIVKADLGDAFGGKDSFLLGIRLEGQYASYASIRSLRLGVPWKQTSGPWDGKMPTVQEVRTRNLWVQNRAVFERAAERFQQTVGENKSYQEAIKLAGQGAYREAYRVLAGAEALSLPAAFVLRGHGALADYPVTVKLAGADDIVLVDLIRAGPDEYSLEFQSEKPVRGTIEIRDLPQGSSFELLKPAPNQLIIRKAENGILNPVGGILTTDISVLGPDAMKRPLPKVLTGMALSSSKEGILIETQEEGLWLDNPHFIPWSTGVQFSRKEHGKSEPVTLDWPKERDRVELVLDESGAATKVSATFGRDQGKIRSFLPPQATGEIHNGIVELENGNRYELANMWRMTDVGGVAPLKPFVRQNSNETLSAGFYPGRTLSIDFTPYNPFGRLPRMVKVTSPDAPRSVKP